MRGLFGCMGQQVHESALHAHGGLLAIVALQQQHTFAATRQALQQVGQADPAYVSLEAHPLPSSASSEPQVQRELLQMCEIRGCIEIIANARGLHVHSEQGLSVSPQRMEWFRR